MKLWAGRFETEPDALVNAFNASLPFDIRLLADDIEGSMAHAFMLGQQGIIPSEDSEALIAELERMRDEVASGRFVVDESQEDVHSLIEFELTKRLGDVGKRIHTGRSRNDQVATAFRLHVRSGARDLRRILLDFLDTLVGIAGEHTDTIMPGYTHLQRAQPITLAHCLLGYAEMIKRDVLRVSDALVRMDVCPLGSGALAGTTYPLDRELTAQRLGFSAVSENSLDGVSDRDFVLEMLSILSIVQMHLSRLAEEVILWCSSEFSFAVLDDAYSTGSSIMPQKKNPDIAELVRGKTGRVYGSLVSLLVTMKGLPLAYNKDMQEDKTPFFDALDTVVDCLRVFAPMLRTLQFDQQRMRIATEKGFLNATDCADYLVKKGLPFREAYQIVGRLVRYCVEHDLTLLELDLGAFCLFSDLFEEDIYQAIALESCVGLRNSRGGPAVTGFHLDLLLQFIKNERERDI